MMLSTTKKTTFTAQLSATLAGQGTVSFKLYRSDRKDLVTGGPEFPIVFETPGRYLKVYVLKKNSLLTCV